MRRRTLHLLGIALTLGLLAGACGNGEDTGAEATATPAAEDGDGGGGGGEIESLASEFEGTDARVAYALTSEAEEGSQDGTVELFWRPSESEWRMDLTFEEQGSTTMISTAEETIVCDPNQESCFRVPAQQAQIPLPFLGDALRSPEDFGETLGQQFSGTAFDRSSRTIAGRDASCFSSTNEEGDFEICFGDDGLLLGWSFDGEGGSSTLEATEVGDVPDDAFDPPYEVQELPQGGQGGQGGQGQPQP